MITPSSVVGIAGCALLVVLFVLMAGRARHRSLRTRLVLLLVGIALSLWPIGGLPFAGYLRGFTGDLSVTTWILALSACIAVFTDKDLYRPLSVHALLLLIAAGALFLYPFALGLTYFDPYSLGYGSTALAVVLSLLCLAAWQLKLYLVLLCIIFAILAFLIGLYESSNLWDYLIDPWVSLYALFRISSSLFTSRFTLDVASRAPHPTR